LTRRWLLQMLVACNSDNSDIDLCDYYISDNNNGVVPQQVPKAAQRKLMSARACGCLPSLVSLSLNQKNTDMRYNNFAHLRTTAPEWVRDGVSDDEVCSICTMPLSGPSGQTTDEGRAAFQIEALEERGEAQRPAQDQESAAREPAAAGKRKREGRLECGHVFHAVCLVYWVGQKRLQGQTPTCPICRIAIPEPVWERMHREFEQFRAERGGSDDESEDDEGPGLEFAPEEGPSAFQSPDLPAPFGDIFQRWYDSLSNSGLSSPDTAALTELVNRILSACEARFAGEAQAPDGLEAELVERLVQNAQLALVANGGLTTESIEKLNRLRDAFKLFFSDIAENWPELVTAVRDVDTTETELFIAMLPEDDEYLLSLIGGSHAGSQTAGSVAGV
jgi:hypothetical protein